MRASTCQCARVCEKRARTRAAQSLAFTPDTLVSMLLSDEVWTLIGFHLKPRHLATLMRTSKAVRAAVDNEAYWTRVAAHLVWRNCGTMEVYSGPKRDPCDILPPPAMNLYYLNGLDVGYAQAMDTFIRRIDVMMTACTQHGDDWTEYQAADLRTRTVMLLKDNTEHNMINFKMTGDEDSISMKALAQRVVQHEARPGRASELTRRFVHELDDHPMPPGFKRDIMDKLGQLLCNLSHPWRPSSADPYDIKCEICQF